MLYVLNVTYPTLLVVLFQALVAMGDKVNITSVPLTCNNNGSSNSDLTFFSTRGVVKLETLDMPFATLSYSVITSATGTGTDLFHLYNVLLKYS